MTDLQPQQQLQLYHLQGKSKKRPQNFFEYFSASYKSRVKVYLTFLITLFMQITKMTLTQFLGNFQAKIFKKYQPSGEGGSRTPPAKSTMAARGPQNGRWGLKRCLPYIFERFYLLSINKFFHPRTPMRIGRTK